MHVTQQGDALDGGFVHGLVVVGNIVLIKILSCVKLLSEVQRLTGTHQYSQFTLLRAVNNPNGSDRLFEILVCLFVLTSNMGKEEMSSWV